MLNLGMSELLLFAIIAVVVLGPDKLPTAMRSVLKWYRQIKMLMTNAQRDIERELEITEIRETMKQEIARFQQIELRMQTQLQQIQKEVEQLDKTEQKLPSPNQLDSNNGDSDAAMTTADIPSVTQATPKQAAQISLPLSEDTPEQQPIDQHQKVSNA